MRDLQESSLSRVWQYVNDGYDVGFISAFKLGKTWRENMAAHKKLRADLLKKGYGVTKLVGTYTYGDNDENTAKELSYMVVDLKGTGNLMDDLKKMIRKYDQESFLFAKNGKGFLVYQNGKVDPIGSLNPGRVNKYYSSRVGGRPFVFESVSEVEEFRSLPPYGKIAVDKTVSMTLDEMEQFVEEAMQLVGADDIG